MNWFKKKKKVTPFKKYYVPEDKIIGLLEASDQAKKNNSKVSRYVLWKKVMIAFPDLDITWGNWEFVTGENDLCPYIVELKGGVRI